MAPLLLFVLIATISPGGATTLATASGANFGLRRSLPLIAGICAGLATMAALAALGLATLLLREPTLRIAMKVIGSAYLVWLAWRTARSGRPDLERGVAKPYTFFGGVGLLWLNPKGWAMTLSAAASFATIAEGPVQLAGMLGMTFALLSGLSLILWCAVGLLLAKFLRSDAQWRALNIVLGILLAASILPIWL
ncbi:LysE family translocator [Rhizobium tumorigenes]|uniref:LysE family translocator n=1 Tax=Rhizobium tumorigenes TaxID=2041385 RepID=A0AAF1K8A3_9HYPH|nr:LysE family translocator [Rhizobium tumorigenes]WFR97927.1 LysE family translocator [Rhizobium tumorigenes]